MATKRQKKEVVAGVTREDAELAFGVYAKAAAESAKIVAQIELETAKVRDRYAERLTTLRTMMGETFETLQAWATESGLQQARKKSVEMAHGTVGFRTGTPRLKTLKGFTWASALELAKRLLPASYLRQTWEIAKDKLLADRELEAVALAGEAGASHEVPMAEALQAVGLEVVQQETFYVEPKSEAIDN